MGIPTIVSLITKWCLEISQPQLLQLTISYNILIWYTVEPTNLNNFCSENDWTYYSSAFYFRHNSLIKPKVSCVFFVLLSKQFFWLGANFFFNILEVKKKKKSLKASYYNWCFLGRTLVAVVIIRAAKEEVRWNMLQDHRVVEDGWSE